MSGININLSVFKRTTRDYEDVEEQLLKDGWTLTDSIGPRENVHYFQKSGVNLTVVDGPMGTLVAPGGPIRGTIFGDDVSLVSKKSDIFSQVSGEGGDKPGVRSNALT